MAPHPKKNMPYFSIFFITINTNKTTSFKNEYLFRKWISNTFSDENLIKNLFIDFNDEAKNIEAKSIEDIKSVANKEIGSKFHRLHAHIIIRVRHWVSGLAVSKVKIREAYKNNSGIPDLKGGETGGIGLYIKSMTDDASLLTFYTLYEDYNKV